MNTENFFYYLGAISKSKVNENYAILAKVVVCCLFFVSVWRQNANIGINYSLASLSGACHTVVQTD